MNTAAVILGSSLLLGVAMPFVAMRMLMPSLEEGQRVENYRGRPLVYGLGIVWLLWAGAAIVEGFLARGLVMPTGTSSVSALRFAGALALVGFALGVVDDAYGGSSSKGFRGHIGALLRGRLTTGGMKLLGISLASFVVALMISVSTPWDVGEAGSPEAGLLARIGVALVAGAAIALTSNFANLVDLRPGRVLKVYTVLALAGVVSTTLGFVPAIATAAGGGSLRLAVRALDVLALAIFLLGPVFAVWRYDLGERAMLGDAGANPMGAVAGLFIVAGLPLWGVVLYFAVMLALNLASERISFSGVIDSNGPLRWLDSLGRARE